MRPKFVGTRLEQKRREHKLSQQELGRMLNVEPSAIANWETERHGTNRSMRHLVAGILRTNPDYLVGKSDDDSPTPGMEGDNGKEAVAIEQPAWASRIQETQQAILEELRSVRELLAQRGSPGEG